MDVAQDFHLDRRVQKMVSSIATSGVIENADLLRLQSLLQLPQVPFKQLQFLLRLEMTNYYLEQGRYEDAAKALPQSAPKLAKKLENLSKRYEFLTAELHSRLQDKSVFSVSPTVKDEVKDEVKDCKMLNQLLPPSASPSVISSHQVLEDSAERSPPLAVPPRQIDAACALSELNLFERDPGSFALFHPELPELERYSLLLNRAVLQERVPLVKRLLDSLGSTRTHSLTVLTCVDKGRYSPATRMLQVENQDIVGLFEQFIGKQADRTKTDRASNDQQARMRASFRYLGNDLVAPLRYLRVLESLYENLDRVVELLKEIGMLVEDKQPKHRGRTAPKKK